MNNVVRCIFLSTLLLICVVTKAELILPHILSDNMVLQQNSSIRLWGKAQAGSIVVVQTDWDNRKEKTKTTKEGLWEITINTKSAGGPYSITILNNREKKVLNNILLGEVWICSGQSNMQMPIKGFSSQPINGSLEAILDSENYKNIRMFTAIRTKSEYPEFDVKGSWEAASINTTADFSALGYFYARELSKTLNVPIGIIHISWGGSNVQAWMGLDNLKTFPEFENFQMDINNKPQQRIPTVLYNGMFYPVHKYSVKGIVWYQGESNVLEHDLYAKLFPAMVQEWRSKIDQGNIPFYYVQIAPYRYDGSDKIESALFRETQLKCRSLIPNSEMAVTMDLGNEYLIHPAEKETIAKRLSFIALANTYGYANLPHTGPIYKDKEIVENKIVLNFDNSADGFMFQSKIKGFEIANETGNFIPAQAKVKGTKQVEVWADGVEKPIHVRYCFKNFSTGNLLNSFGLPASSFRTDI